MSILEPLQRGEVTDPEPEKTQTMVDIEQIMPNQTSEVTDPEAENEQALVDSEPITPKKGQPVADIEPVGIDKEQPVAVIGPRMLAKNKSMTRIEPRRLKKTACSTQIENVKKGTQSHFSHFIPEKITTKKQPTRSRYAELWDIGDMMVDFHENESYKNYVFRENRFAELLIEFEECSEVPDIDKFTEFVIFLTLAEQQQIVRKKCLNRLATSYKHAPKMSGLSYDTSEVMTPLLFALLRDNEKIKFLIKFSESRTYTGDSDIEPINSSLNELIFNGSREFILRIIHGYPDMYLKAQDDNIFCNMYKKSEALAGEAITDFISKCEDDNSEGNNIVQFWSKKHYSRKVKGNKYTMFRYSHLGFIKTILNYYSR